MNIREISLDSITLGRWFVSGELTPSLLAEEIWRRCEAAADPGIWIHRLNLGELMTHARRIESKSPHDQPLFGLPFAIKDNIDLAGVPTTAGCPEYTYVPTESSTVVSKLLEAGALPIGKTNLDQFATGLVGTRSPFGVPRNPFHPDLIPGGSSSGSAVAVARGLLTFALGTDTAGSGRVPASLNNIVGLKPTRGWLSTMGVVPACRSLDCVSVFGLTVPDVQKIGRVGGTFDPADPYSRRPQFRPVKSEGSAFRFGVPAAKDLEWFGDQESAAVFARAVSLLETLGGQQIEIDFSPFREAGRLLYEGPWLAERWSVIREFNAKHPEAIFPITRQIIESGAGRSAADAFLAFHRLEQLRRDAETIWPQIEALVLPTAATIYTRSQIEANPITLNSRLGYYTNFANLLDCAALAIPAGLRADGIPFGITFCGPAWSDSLLAALGDRFHRAAVTTLGATNWAFPDRDQEEFPAAPPTGHQWIAVVGAHLRGQPLNRELTDRGGQWLRTVATADCYRLYALAGTKPAKPGLLRVAEGAGNGVEVEIWSLPTAGWGDFVANIPSPLGIGTLILQDGTKTKGFLCEPAGLEGAADITHFGGWRNYLASLTSK